MKSNIISLAAQKRCLHLFHETFLSFFYHLHEKCLLSPVDELLLLLIQYRCIVLKTFVFFHYSNYIYHSFILDRKPSIIHENCEPLHFCLVFLNYDFSTKSSSTYLIVQIDFLLSKHSQKPKHWFSCYLVHMMKYIN